MQLPFALVSPFPSLSLSLETVRGLMTRLITMEKKRRWVLLGFWLGGWFVLEGAFLVSLSHCVNLSMSQGQEVQESMASRLLPGQERKEGSLGTLHPESLAEEGSSHVGTSSRVLGPGPERATPTLIHMALFNHKDCMWKGNRSFQEAWKDSYFRYFLLKNIFLS